MNDDRGSSAGSNLNRRDFLAAGALPLAGALDSSSLSKDGPFMMRKQQGPVRLGFIGAGANVRNVMIPGLIESPGVALLAVANRSLASSQRAADEVGISRPYSHWEELLRDDDVDAEVIGKWPYICLLYTTEAADDS